MMESLTNRRSRNARVRISHDGLLIETEDPKAVFHQRGTSRMPARPVLRLTEAQKRGWVRIIQSHVLGDGSEPASPFSGLLGI